MSHQAFWLNALFTYTRLNLYLDLLQSLDSTIYRFFKANDKKKKNYNFRKQIVQLFKEALTETCTFSVFLNAHLGFENFATIFACFNLLIQIKT